MWDFLEKMDKNLLYDYVGTLTGKIRRLRIEEKTDNSFEEQYRQDEKIKNRAYYLIWFVYYYVLECKTLEQALGYADEDTLKTFHLNNFFNKKQPAIYLGIDKDICLWYITDITIVLEILYNRYGFFEQLDCFIRHTNKNRQKKCIEAKERYLKIYKKKEETKC